jgi:hypothetical protein
MDPSTPAPRTPPPFVPPVGELAHEAGPRAIEIAAMLDDSIVTVRHLSDPRSGKISRATIGLFAAGATLLLIALVTFVHGVRVSAQNERARAAWIQADRPTDEFRPVRISGAADPLALSGLVFGLAAIFWGLARVGEERRPACFRIGTSRDVDFPTAALPVESFPLVAPAADGEFVFRKPPGAAGERLFAGEATPIAELPEETAIPPGARFRVEAGPATFLISSVPKPSRTRTALFAALEGTALAFLAGSALAHGLVLAFLYSIPPDEKNLVGRELFDPGRLIRVQAQATEPPIVEPVEAGPDDGPGSEGLGNAAAGPEGEMGKKNGPAEEKRFKLEKQADTVQLAREELVAQAVQHAGVLGVYRNQRGGAFGTLINSADFSSGLDDVTVYGGLAGREYGDSDGGFGLGMKGWGPGGNGTGLNSIGVGRGPLGTIGPGAGGKTGVGYCVGCSGDRNHGRRAGGPRVSPGPVVSLSGDLDRELIRRYIRQKTAQFQHCYERRLIVQHDLEGTVTLQFTIAGSGQVTSANASGMDSEVASCSADVVRSIQFPRPHNGGVVNVSRYPLTFHAAE